MRITNEEKMRAAERELGMRVRVYPNWVKAGRMSKEKADREIEVMRAIADDYRAKVEAVTP